MDIERLLRNMVGTLGVSLALASCQTDGEFAAQSVGVQKERFVPKSELVIYPNSCSNSSDCSSDSICDFGKCKKHVPTKYCDNKYFVMDTDSYRCAEFWDMAKEYRNNPQIDLLYECREKPLEGFDLQMACPEGTKIMGGQTSYRCISDKPFNFVMCRSEFKLKEDNSQVKDVIKGYFVRCDRKGLKRYMSDYQWQISDESICGDTGAHYLANYSSVTPDKSESGYCCVRK